VIIVDIYHRFVKSELDCPGFGIRGLLPADSVDLAMDANTLVDALLLIILDL
jgi:hypothetical protein